MGVHHRLDLYLQEFISHICERPQMYTLNGTFGEVIAYLHGHMDGSKAEGAAACAQLQGFERWLQQRLGYPADCLWVHIINQAFPEGQALGQLRLLFEEYELSKAQHGAV